jgi:putative peptidoglycan lipid II flippase
VLGRPTIRVLFQHGKFDAAAGSLTYRVLALYALALPAAVAVEVLTRGLIALRDTRTPLASNTMQLAARAGIIAALLGTLGARAIPLAFAAAATLEALVLATILLFRLRKRIAEPVPAAPIGVGS